jgi:anion-transporting  ArsA/GET3 family ATPase
MAEDLVSSIARRRFVFVTGKGGVGKTTVCAALALKLAAQGKRVLVAMCHAKERLSDMLGTAPIGDRVREVSPRVWAVNMDPEVALEEYGMMALKSRTLYTLLFDIKYVRTFFRAVPGIHEWSMLGKAWWHTTEERAPGEPLYDVVLLDAPATGHGLDMLRVPKVIVEIVPPGLLRRDAEAAWKLFQDPARCGALLVALPEEMPTTETIELAASLRDELKIPVGGVVINAVLPTLFPPNQAGALLAKTERSLGPETPVGDALVMARRRAEREAVQAECIERLSQSMATQPHILPLLFDDAATPTGIRQLVDAL